MVSESSAFNPIAVLVHLLAIGAGLYLGFVAMDAIAPDLPDDDVAPGVESSVAPDTVGGGDANSLFTGPALAAALIQLDEQMPDGDGIVRLHIEPGTLDAETRAGEGLFEPTDVAPSLPAQLVRRIAGTTSRNIDLDDVSYFDLVATQRGPKWYVQLDAAEVDFPPPWTYGADIDTGHIVEGPPPPEPIVGQ
jgi:hypothetical protein